MYINTTDGGALLDTCTVEQNGADGIKFVHHEESLRFIDRNTNALDFCTIPTTSSQIFPIVVNFVQDLFSLQPKECRQVGVNRFYLFIYFFGIVIVLK